MQNAEQLDLVARENNILKNSLNAQMHKNSNNHTYNINVQNVADSEIL